MRAINHFATTVLLDDGSPGAETLRQRLQSVDCEPHIVHLDRRAVEPPWSALLAATPQGLERGLLFMAPQVALDSPAWSRHDRAVEQLETVDWQVAYLGHAEGAGDGIGDDGPGTRLQRSDRVPEQLCALALRGQTLREVLELMPTRPVNGNFGASEWLTIAAWLALDRHGRSRSWLAWPALMRHAPAPAVSVVA